PGQWESIGTTTRIDSFRGSLNLKRSLSRWTIADADAAADAADVAAAAIAGVPVAAAAVAVTDMLLLLLLPESPFENGCLYSHIRWGEAFVVVYSVTCKRSFQEARGLLKQLADLRLPSYFTALLLGNKRDLDHAREVCVDEGQQLSLAHGCQFYEVSAAESPAGAALAFQALLREARSVQLLRALPIRRKLGVHSVSRVLGTIFGKNTTKDRKKRPSLSI
ncbi:ras-related and estrogen-regulated growth inhibitor-like, partial [Vespula maculifrons]